MRRSAAFTAALIAAPLWGCQPAPQLHPPEAPPAPEASASVGDAPPTSPPTPAPGILAEADLVALRASGAFDGLPTREAAVILDPAYHAEKRYRGWPLAGVLEAALGALTLGPGQEVQLIAADGYTAVVPAAQLQGAEGVLAFADVDAPEGEAWLPFQQGKRTVTPAPFYLVWDGIPYGPDHPWPYQLARLRVVDVAVAYGAAFPEHAPEVRPGFDLFKARCSACHSVNLVGGTLGPELNVPRSVTEYWPAEHLRGLIREPRAYRARSVMPALGLTDAEIDAVLAYLVAMGDHKICATAASCEAAP